MNWRSHIKSILANINPENNTKVNIFNGYHTKYIQDLFNRHRSKNITQWWTISEESPKRYWLLLHYVDLNSVKKCLTTYHSEKQNASAERQVYNALHDLLHYNSNQLFCRTMVVIYVDSLLAIS